MKTFNHKKKAIVLSLVLSSAMLIPTSALAQECPEGGGLFKEGEALLEDVEGLFFDSKVYSEEGGYSLFNQQFGSDANGGYDLHNQTFGQDDDTPLVSGLFILAAAGVGYAFKKRKKNN